MKKQKLKKEVSAAVHRERCDIHKSNNIKNVSQTQRAAAGQDWKKIGKISIKLRKKVFSAFPF